MNKRETVEDFRQSRHMYDQSRAEPTRQHVGKGCLKFQLCRLRKTSVSLSLLHFFHSCRPSNRIWSFSSEISLDCAAPLQKPTKSPAIFAGKTAPMELLPSEFRERTSRGEFTGKVHVYGTADSGITLTVCSLFARTRGAISVLGRCDSGVILSQGVLFCVCHRGWSQTNSLGRAFLPQGRWSHESRNEGTLREFCFSHVTGNKETDTALSCKPTLAPQSSASPRLFHCMLCGIRLRLFLLPTTITTTAAAASITSFLACLLPSFLPCSLFFFFFFSSSSSSSSFLLLGLLASQ